MPEFFYTQLGEEDLMAAAMTGHGSVDIAKRLLAKTEQILEEATNDRPEPEVYIPACLRVAEAYLSGAKLDFAHRRPLAAEEAAEEAIVACGAVLAILYQYNGTGRGLRPQSADWAKTNPDDLMRAARALMDNIKEINLALAHIQAKRS